MDVVERQLEATVAVAHVQVFRAAAPEVASSLHLYHDESVEQERDDERVLTREEQVRVAEHAVPGADGVELWLGKNTIEQQSTVANNSEQ